jgi:hypothetical protein
MAIPDIWDRAGTDIPFDIPNLRVENGPAKAHVRIGWLRSVANIYQRSRCNVSPMSSLILPGAIHSSISWI